MRLVLAVRKNVPETDRQTDRHRYTEARWITGHYRAVRRSNKKRENGLLIICANKSGAK